MRKSKSNSKLTVMQSIQGNKQWGISVLAKLKNFKLVIGNQVISHPITKLPNYHSSS